MRYDKIGRMVFWTNKTIHKSINYLFDKEGNRVSMIDAEGRETVYTYSELNNLISITNGDKYICSFKYDAMNRVIRQTNANKTFSIYEFDQAGNLLKLLHKKENLDLIEKFCYTVDKVGNSMSMTNLAEGTQQGNGAVIYRYDNTYQLTQANYPDGQYEVFNYNEAGNRTNYIKNGTNTKYSYNIEDQLLQSGNTAYQYDLNGNQIKSITAGITNNYIYNEENLLSKFSNANVLSKYYYNPFNRRINKNINGTNQFFIYSGDDVIAEYNNSTNQSMKYIMHPRKIDNPLMSVIPTAGGILMYYYYKDGLGSIIALANTNATIKNTYKYYAFGSSRSKTETIPNRYQYTSREKDNENNLYYYRSRMYNPMAGRFIQKDKIFYEFKKNELNSFNIEAKVQFYNERNIYTYVINNPISFTDPKGDSIVCKIVCEVIASTICFFLPPPFNIICEVVGIITCLSICVDEADPPPVEPPEEKCPETPEAVI